MKKRILILSGPTHEYIDPVRFIGNASSGRMGKAIAEEAAARGYSVDFITGPVAEENLPAFGDSGRIHQVISAADMLASAGPLFDAADIIVFAAAVADYAPAKKCAEKIAKSDELLLQLKSTPDIARSLCAQKRENQTAIGFALQTSDGESNARRKLKTKNLDGIVLNTPASLGAKDGTFSFLAAGTDGFKEWGCIDKTKCAQNIFNAIDSPACSQGRA